MKVSRRFARGRGSVKVALVLATMASMVGAGLASVPASAGTKKLPPLVVGGIFPFTGSKSLLSSWGTHGVKVGIY